MSVFKRPGRSYYYAEFSIGGQRILRSTGCTTEREARAEEKRLKAEAKAQFAERRGVEALTVDQGFGKYWHDYSEKLALTWRLEVERYIKHILAHTNPQILIEDVTDHEVDHFVQAHKAAGGGAYALNRSLAVWRRMHNLARKKWKQKTHVIDWTDFLNEETERERHIELDESRILLRCSTERLGHAIRWSLLTGTRRSETFSLTWDNVEIGKGKATVIAKGGRKHTVWLSAEAIELLTSIRRRGRYVFDRTNWRRDWENAVKRSGLGDLRWHDLRHTHATWLRQAKVPLEIVQRSLGHADLQTTMRYAHVADFELREALTKLPSISTIHSTVVPFNSIKSKA
jgi:integrase